jgi:signal transduction histidine kinase
VRVLWAGLLVGLALAALLGGWFVTGWRGVRAEAARIEAAPADQASRRAALLATELGGRIEELRSAESQRPYYEYQNLYHDPRGASEGKSVVPSPLARGPSDVLVAAHFQIEPSGRVSIPTVNEDLPELSDPMRVERDRGMLAALRASAEEVRPLAVASAFPASKPAPAPAPPRRRTPRPKPEVPPAPNPPRQQVVQQQAVDEPQIQTIDQSAYTQNQAANTVYQDVKQQQVARPRPAKKPTPQQARPAQTKPAPTKPAQTRPAQTKPAASKPTKPTPPPPTIVEVRVSPFVWRTISLERTPRLVALRTVGTPDGTLTQGFALEPGALGDWLAQRASEFPTAFEAGVPDTDTAALLPLAGTTWHIAVDPSRAASAARQRSGELERRFLLQFIPAALLAILCGGLVVLLVARADRLARQRSGFAAAAAHELRTPLAGLALYGDMLADGLGDPERHAAYARRIADEAARLGRVVGNVLGFTQLERRALALSAREGDAAEAARQAADRMRPALEHAGMSLTVEAPGAAPARFDDDAVQRILQNLLDNAEKYSREASDRVVELSVRPADGTVELQVADRGPGVPRPLRRRLFRPFSRGADTGPAGLGLGLALARAQARAMGGDLTYQPREGGGSVFSLRLSRG